LTQLRDGTEPNTEGVDKAGSEASGTSDVQSDLNGLSNLPNESTLKAVAQVAADEILRAAAQRRRLQPVSHARSPAALTADVSDATRHG
jgi:hypothetical protein